MSVSNIVTVNVSATGSQVSLPGFGIPLILMPSTETPAAFTERYRLFSTGQEMLDLGFVTTDQTYIEALGFFNQNPRVSSVAVGRRAAAVAQVSNVALGGVGADGNYTVTIAGTDFTHAAVGQTPAQIMTAIDVLINASSVPVTSVDNTGDLDLTADVAGIPFTLTTDAPTPADFTITATTPNTGIPEDLVAISNENDDWYCLQLTVRDAPHIATAAAAIQPLYKVFHAQSSDADILTAVSTDIFSQLQALNYSRTMMTYHPTDGDAMASSWSGTKLHEVAGQTSWAFKTPVGVAAITLNSTERANLKSKNGNFFEALGGLPNYTQFGKMASTTGFLWMDEVRGSDQLVQRMQVETLAILAKHPPMSQKGIEAVAGGARTALIQSTNDGFIASARVNAVTGETETPAYTVTPPNINDIPTADKNNRLIPASNPIRWEATMGGGINAVTIVGTLSAA